MDCSKAENPLDKQHNVPLFTGESSNNEIFKEKLETRRWLILLMFSFFT